MLLMSPKSDTCDIPTAPFIAASHSASVRAAGAALVEAASQLVERTTLRRCQAQTRLLHRLLAG